MSKAQEAREMADGFNQPEQKAKRMAELVGHVVDILIEDALVAAKRGLYDMSYKMEDMEKERVRLANLQEEEVLKGAIDKMNELGFQAGFSRPYVNVSWK
jgi:ACT domain-containing protein